jgi:hypothetical protein
MFFSDCNYNNYGYNYDYTIIYTIIDMILSDYDYKKNYKYEY